MRMAGVHVILAVVYETPVDVLMYNEKRYNGRNYQWLKTIFNLPVGENLCSYACIVAQAAQMWDVMICKGINTSTINISLTYSLWCWYISTVDGDIIPGTTPVYSPISHKTSCADLCCYVSAQTCWGIFLSHFTLSLLTIWQWSSRPVIITLETDSHLLQF